jgi:hypothetical protein
MQHNNHTAYQANRTPNLAQQPQLFVQEIRAQHRANQDGQRAQRRHQNCRRKRIRREVEYLAEYHCLVLALHPNDVNMDMRIRPTCRYARPPRRIPQISKAIAVEAMFLHARIEALFRNDKTRAYASLVFHPCCPRAAAESQTYR